MHIELCQVEQGYQIQVCLRVESYFTNTRQFRSGRTGCFSHIVLLPTLSINEINARKTP